MAINLKGRRTIRSRTPSGREPRHIEPLLKSAI
jgi:hypothetical protein